MQLFIKVVILFLIIFNFRIPVIYNSSVLSVILSASYYIFIRRSIPFTFFYRTYNVTILIGLLVLCFITLSFTMLHGQYEFTLLKVQVLQFFMLFALIFALPILIDEENNAFEQAAYIICGAFSLQGFIQLMAYLIPSFGDFMIAMKPPEFQQFFILNPELRFRGFALTGSPFFELPCGFGVAFILFFRSLYIDGQKFITGNKKYVMFLFFFVGSMFSGRTAFVGLGMAVGLVFFMAKDPINSIFRTVRIIIALSFALVIVYSLLLPSNLRDNISNTVFPYAFEFFYSFEETGKISTVSSDALDGHYYSLPIETILHGDGKYLDPESRGYYGGTDAGYMRMLLYGGVPFFICLLIYQYLYFSKPLYYSRRGITEEDRKDYWCLLFLFIHLFILEYKSDTIANQNIMQVLLLFLGSAYMIRYYYREQETVESVEN